MRRRKLLLLLALANLLAALSADPPPPASLVRQLRARAQAEALAAGRRTYTFETTWRVP